MTAAEVIQVFVNWERYESESGAPQRTGMFCVEPLPFGHSAGEYTVRATQTLSPLGGSGVPPRESYEPGPFTKYESNEHRLGVDGEGI